MEPVNEESLSRFLPDEFNTQIGTPHPAAFHLNEMMDIWSNSVYFFILELKEELFPKSTGIKLTVILSLCIEQVGV